MTAAARSDAVLTLTLAGVEAALALCITFTPAHTATGGMILVALWAAATAVLRGVSRTVLPVQRAHAAAAVLVCGAAGALLAIGAESLGLLITLVVAAVVSAVISVIGSRSGNGSRERVDENVYAVIAGVFVCAVVIVPHESVHIVGLFGMYLAALAVFRGIAGLGYFHVRRGSTREL